LQVYRALAIATNDAHGTLDVMLSASNPDVDRRPLQQDESPAMKAIAATRLLKCTHSR
jgi:heme oxygenase